MDFARTFADYIFAAVAAISGILLVDVDVSAGFEIKNRHRIETLIEKLAQRRFALAQLGRSHLALGINPITVCNFLLETKLHFLSSGDLRGQFTANSLELALGGLAPADLIFGDVGLVASHSESNTLQCAARCT